MLCGHSFSSHLPSPPAPPLLVFFFCLRHLLRRCAAGGVPVQSLWSLGFGRVAACVWIPATGRVERAPGRLRAARRKLFSRPRKGRGGGCCRNKGGFWLGSVCMPACVRLKFGGGAAGGGRGLLFRFAPLSLSPKCQRCSQSSGDALLVGEETCWLIPAVGRGLFRSGESCRVASHRPSVRPSRSADAPLLLMFLSPPPHASHLGLLWPAFILAAKTCRPLASVLSCAAGGTFENPQSDIPGHPSGFLFFP